MEINENITNQNINQNILNQITIDCLLNKGKKNKTNQVIKPNKKDKKFYRRRILNLTKEMLLNNYADDLLLDVHDAFETYVKSCIGYFKLKDETEIIQEEYNIDSLLDEITQDKLDADDIVSPEEANKLMMRSITLNNRPLDNFVKIKYLKAKEDIVIPKQKEINLQDPLLKKKGIPKKKNISDTYKNEK
jgi:hypothetical protein